MGDDEDMVPKSIPWRRISVHNAILVTTYA